MPTVENQLMGDLTPAPFRVGIWCDYGSTILPNQRAGVFVYNLVRGFLGLEEPVDLVLLVKEGDQRRVASITGKHSRLRVLSNVDIMPRWWRAAFRFLKRWIDCSDQIHRQKNLASDQFVLSRGRIGNACKSWLKTMEGSSKWKKIPALLAAVICIPALVVLLWAGYAILRYSRVTLQVLGLPWRLLDRLFRKKYLSLKSEAVRTVECDAWIVPDILLNQVLPFPAVVMVDDFAGSHFPNEYERLNPGYHVSTSQLMSQRAEEAAKCICTSAYIRDRDLVGVLKLSRAKTRVIRLAPQENRTWVQVAREFLQVCQEVTPKLFSIRPEVFLFLQDPYLGGIWETTKDLVRALVEINARRGQLRIIIGVNERQKDTEPLERLEPNLTLVRFRFDEIATQGAEIRFGQDGKKITPSLGDRFAFMKGCESEALRADAWLALVDRFPAPLLPLRPYGVIVYDMIQRHVPQTFAPIFFKWAKEGISPTMQNAECVLVTSPPTRDDVIAEYQLDPARIQLVPVACEPSRRFDSITRQHVSLPREPFILCVANAGGHKGADVLLRGYTRLRQKLGRETPLLVLAGAYTDAYSPNYRGQLDDPWWVEIRKLVRDLALAELDDVVFLGHVTDDQLYDLYERSAVVVNATKNDNGSFTLVEGAYFGRPLVSSRYPAVEYLCERFGISVEYFSVGDVDGLAETLERALKEKPIQGVELDQLRDKLKTHELSYSLYAERIYNILVDLANQGRKQRLSQLSGSPKFIKQHAAA